MSLDLFRVISKIYTAPNLDWVEDIDSTVSNVPIVLIMSYNYKMAHIVSKLDKYTYRFDTAKFCMLAWSYIQPKYIKTPFAKKIKAIDEEVTRYQFLLDKIQKRLEISNNDWKYCKQYFIEDIKKNTKEYLVLYGCPKKNWNNLGLDIEESKKMNVVDIVEGLDRFF